MEKSNDEIVEPKIIVKYPLACYLVGFFLIFYVFIAILAIFLVHLGIFTILSSTQILRTHILCGAFGMLGAAMATCRKFYKYLITYSTAKLGGHHVLPMDWSFGWIYYYLTRPIMGSVLGALTFLLSFIGFSILTDSPMSKISSKGNYFLYAISYISGFSVSNIFDRLAAVSKQIFKSESKD